MIRNLVMRATSIATRAPQIDLKLLTIRNRVPMLYSRSLSNYKQKPGDSNDKPEMQGEYKPLDRKKLQEFLERLELEDEMRQEGNYGYWVAFLDEEVEAYKARKAKRNTPN